ncbi:MAG: UdgX family uracil-DNA binding protein [Vicinamibacterales bacterium]
MFVATIEPTYQSWHAQARVLLASSVQPQDVVWFDSRTDQPLLASFAQAVPLETPARVRVPRRFVDMASQAARHHAPTRWDLLYRVLWRITHGERTLLDNELDEDTIALRSLVRAVKEDAERMKAFVRFRSIGPQGAEHFVAWHRPDFDVVSLVAAHFAERYPNLKWSILTPFASVHWDGRELSFARGVAAQDIPAEDSNRAAEALWRTYYAAAFNPARANEAKLSRDMPARFRPSLPEAAAIPTLLADASARAESLRAATGGVTSRALVPPTRDLAVLRESAKACTGCDLYRHATQTVFGEGPSSASIVIVGEQPGDSEDRHGRPFVGPAGELFDRALLDAGLARAEIYVTNAVKHFAWEPRGKRRIHRTPRLSEMRACRPWVEAELAAVAPRVVVCLGGTAAQSLLGPQARVNALRGRVITGQSWAPAVVVTFHPAAVLRSANASAQQVAYASLVADLKLAAAARE